MDKHVIIILNAAPRWILPPPSWSLTGKAWMAQLGQINHMGVSIHGATPKFHPFFSGIFHEINHPVWGYPHRNLRFLELYYHSWGDPLKWMVENGKSHEKWMMRRSTQINNHGICWVSISSWHRWSYHVTSRLNCNATDATLLNGRSGDINIISSSEKVWVNPRMVSTNKWMVNGLPLKGRNM